MGVFLMSDPLCLGGTSRNWAEWRKTVKIAGMVLDQRRVRDNGPSAAIAVLIQRGKLVWRDGHIDLPERS